ncbi:unnamed protein product [Caenorhabditis nigoni]
MPIALLNFPTDLIGDVFKECNPFELYSLSKCSKKVRNIVKLGDTKKWKISYWGWKEIIIHGDGSKYIFSPTEKPEDYFKIDNSEKRMCIQSPGDVELFFYLIDTLAIRIVRTLGIQFGNFDNFLEIVKVLISRNMEIERLWIGYMRNLHDLANFMPLMSQMRLTKEFKCLPIFPPDFDYQFVNYPSYIHISYAFGFSNNRLLTCPCTRIELGDSGLSNRDLNVFFEKWKKAGTFPNLQWLEIKSRSIDNLSALFDMVPPITRTELPRQQVLIRFSEDDEVIMDDGVRITKEDGTEAWLKVELGFVPKLQLLVYNPSNTWVEEVDDGQDFEDEE